MMDWNDFASKVPAGAQAKFLLFNSDTWAHGIILENKPYHLMDREEHSVYTQDALRFDGFDYFRSDREPSYRIEVDRMLYLVDGEWLTIIQVLTRGV